MILSDMICYSTITDTKKERMKKQFAFFNLAKSSGLMTANLPDSYLYMSKDDLSGCSLFWKFQKVDESFNLQTIV